MMDCKHPTIRQCDVCNLEQQLAAANARIADLEYKLMAQTETALQEKAKREQAEAQCALLKQENSKLASAAIEKPPHKQDLLARMKRMEDALREISNVTSKCLSHEEMKDKMKKIAKVALEEKP